MLTLSHIRKDYGKFTAVEDINLELENGLYAMLRTKWCRENDIDQNDHNTFVSDKWRDFIRWNGYL